MENTATEPFIFLVEDDQDIAYMVRFILEREKYRVVHAADGRQAAALLGGAPPVLAILDIMLPYVNGFQLLEMIRANARWSALPVIMLTARTQEADVVRALDAGANDYIAKPFMPEELLARVRRLLQTKL